MRGPRHISACIDEWLDSCPFNLPDALDAIREEYDMARHQSSKDETTPTHNEQRTAP